MKNANLKKEYTALLRSSNTALKKELKKPTAEQDQALIDECLENVSFCEKELASLRAERAVRKGASFGSLRRAGAALLVLVLSFAAFATVSEAAGFRVWTAIIKRDAGYLRVDYVPEPTRAPAELSAGWSDGEYSFFSRMDFDRRLELDGFTPFSNEWEGCTFIEGSVRSTEKDYYASYSLRTETCSIRVRMIYKAGEPSPVTVWGMDESIPYYDIDVGGIHATYQTQADGCVFATWQSGGRIFCASIFEADDAPETVLRMIIR